MASSSDGTTLFAGLFDGGSTGGIYASTNSGSTWTLVLNNPNQGVSNNNFRNISCSSDGSKAIACENGGYVWISTNATTASTWSQQNPAGTPGYLGAACDSAGVYMYTSANSISQVYRRNVSAGTWTTITPSVSGPSYFSLACSLDGSVVWICENGGKGGIYYSTNFGSTWTTTSAPKTIGGTTQWTSIACSAAGIYNVIACASGGNIYVRDINDVWTAQTSAGTGAWSNVASSLTGSFLVAAGNGLDNSAAFIYTATQNGPDPTCFKEGTTILCLIDGKETYVAVENMRKGTLVKTSDSVFLPVTFIGSSKIYNPANSLRYSARLFVCSKDKFPELTEDLIITGGHAILYDSLTEKEKADTIEQVGRIMITENKYRLMAVHDERALPYESEGLFNIWHFSLTNAEYDWNYGVYANGGLLVETASERVMKEASGLVLLD